MVRPDESMNSSSPKPMPFSVWTRKNSIDQKKGAVWPLLGSCLLRPLHLARRRLRRGGGLEARVGDRGEAAVFHVDLGFPGPALRCQLVQREHIERLDELVVALAHLDLAELAVVLHAFEQIGR